MKPYCGVYALMYRNFIWKWINAFENISISDQVLSITPYTQEQVEVLKNVSTQYEVNFKIDQYLHVYNCPALTQDTCFPLSQLYGSLFHLSTSRRMHRSTFTFLQTAPRGSGMCYSSMASHMSMLPVRAWTPTGATVTSRWTVRFIFFI